MIGQVNYGSVHTVFLGGGLINQVWMHTWFGCTPGFLKLLCLVHWYVRVQCDIAVCDWLKKFYGFSTFQLLYITLAVDRVDGHGL